MSDLQYPRYLVRKAGRNGVVRYYWQPSTTLRAEGWKPLRVPDGWGDYADPNALELAAIVKAEEINAELEKVRGGRKVRTLEAARTVGDLVKRYLASREFKALRDTSKRNYRHLLNVLVERLGETRLREVDKPRVQRLKAALQKTPSQADHVLVMLRTLLAFGVRYGLLKVNPAMEFGGYWAPPSGIPWPRAAVAHFVATADAMRHWSIGTAVALDEWIGQREGDVIRIQWRAYRDGALLVSQSKTGAGVQLPVDMIPALKQRLEEEFARQAAWRAKVAPLRLLSSRRMYAGASADAAMIVTNERTRRPYTLAAFQKAFGRVRAKAAKGRASFGVDFIVPGRKAGALDAFSVTMAELQFRHLRHTAITRLAEAGCEDSLICAITGHSHAGISNIISRYLSRTKTMAAAAFAKRLAVEQALENVKSGSGRSAPGKL